MPQRALRFGIHDDADRRAATWKLWTETSDGKSELYLTNRSLGGVLKASLHESGKWHIAYSKSTFENKVKGANPKFKDRFIEKWPRPPEFQPGATKAFSIVTPWSAVANPIKGSNVKKVDWIPNAPEGKATEIQIIITQPTIELNGWPGKKSPGTSLIGSISLENGETAWVVYWVVDMPDFSSLRKATLRPYKGVKKENIPKEGLRIIIFGTAPDGSKVMYDCAVQNKIDENQL